MANISSINGNPIVPDANTITDAMLVQTGGVLEEVKYNSRMIIGTGENKIFNWEAGAINDSTGVLINAARIRTDAIKVYGNQIKFYVPSGIQLRVYQYTDTAFIGSGAWHYGETSVSLELQSGCTYIRLSAVKRDGTEISVGDADAAYVYEKTRLDAIDGAVTALTGDIADINENLDEMNCRNLLDLASYGLETRSYNGVTYVPSGGHVTVTGTASASSYYELYTNMSAMPDGIEAGKTYYVPDVASAENVRFVIYYSSNGSSWTYLGTYDKAAQVTIPQSAIGLLARLSVAANLTANATIYPAITTAYSNAMLKAYIDDMAADVGDGYADVRFVCGFGTGDCTIMKFSDGSNLFIDFGLNEGQHVWRDNFRSAISELGITHIDNMIISHYHSDHVGMILAGEVTSLIDSSTKCYLPQQFTSEQIDALETYDKQANDSVHDNYLAVTSALANCQKIYPTEGQTVTIGGASVEFWNTDHTAYLDQIVAGTLLDYNPCSLCCYVTIGTTVMCFSGDINLDVMNSYAKKLRPCNIYKAHHHAVGYATVPLYMNTVYPDAVITMIGTAMVSGSMGRQSDGLHVWCEANDVPNYITGAVGANIKIRVSNGGWKFTSKAHRYIVADEASA